MCAPTVSMVVKHLKEYVTKHLHHPIWQKSFHDHVIRTQTDYETIWLYIDSTPPDLADGLPEPEPEPTPTI